jgi:hypothetical protein
MSNVIFLVASLLANVKCNFFGCIDVLFEYGGSTTGYGCLGETSITGHTPFTSFKDVSTLSPSMQEVTTTIMEVNNEVTLKLHSQTIKKVFQTKHVKPHQSPCTMKEVL